MMKKRQLIITIIIAIIILIVGGTTFFIYQGESKNKGIEKAKQLIEQRQYDKALASFELVLDEDSGNIEAIEGKDMLDKYIEAEKNVKDCDFKKAEEEIKELPSSYTNYSFFKSDVDKLKEKIEEGLKANTSTVNDINKLRTLIDNKKYDEAKKLVNKLNNEKLTEEQKNTVKDLNARLSAEIKISSQSNEANNDSNSNKSQSNSTALSKEKYLGELNNIQRKADNVYVGDTDPEMREAIGYIYTLWDNELNRIYQDLKNNLPKDQFKKLEKEEVQWIKEKKRIAQKEADQYKGGTLAPLTYTSTEAEETKKRCYELVNNYMK
ncbi:lysozyme inhibitor LprI family protein [Clostridium sp. Ade.TY]|uniref:lysozyme inhibitor LprI family protein n=1 Tax=Clostridium sp. Ade.TY TaxID=1391647 RepID=UPI00041A6D71|nr:lysozyme inhibitor LprI family protein [Clostridium sp. Ade.TY]